MKAILRMAQENNAERTPLFGGGEGLGPPERGVCGLGVFAKHWTPGQTKTRLAASIGIGAAADVSRQLLQTTLERLSKLRMPGLTRQLAYSPADRGPEFEALIAGVGGGWCAAAQSLGDLGTRMKLHFESALREAGSAVLVGSDSPHLPLEAVVEAIDWLSDPSAERRLVLGPTTDGGYWLIGAAGPLPPIFDAMPWSDPALLQATLDRLAEAGWREGADYRLLPRWYDVDDEHDLARLRAELPGGDAELVRLATRLDELLGPNKS